VADFGLKDMAFQLDDSYTIDADILREILVRFVLEYFLGFDLLRILFMCLKPTRCS